MYGTRRDWVRTEHWNIIAQVSPDGEHWSPVQVPDISSGGLMILTDKIYQEEDELSIELNINTMMFTHFEEMKMHIRATVAIKSCRGKQRDLYAYGVGFTMLSNGDRIRLDELIRMTNAKYGLDHDILYR